MKRFEAASGSQSHSLRSTLSSTETVPGNGEPNVHWATLCLTEENN